MVDPILDRDRRRLQRRVRPPPAWAALAARARRRSAPVLRSACKELFSMIEQDLESDQRLLLDLFVSYDDDLSGALVGEELELFVRTLDPGGSPETLQGYLETVDTDGSKSVELVELLEWYRRTTATGGFRQSLSTHLMRAGLKRQVTKFFSFWSQHPLESRVADMSHVQLVTAFQGLAATAADIRDWLTAAELCSLPGAQLDEGDASSQFEVLYSLLEGALGPEDRILLAAFSNHDLDCEASMTLDAVERAVGELIPEGQLLRSYTKALAPALPRIASFADFREAWHREAEIRGPEAASLYASPLAWRAVPLPVAGEARVVQRVRLSQAGRARRAVAAYGALYMEVRAQDAERAVSTALTRAAALSNAARDVAGCCASRRPGSDTPTVGFAFERVLSEAFSSNAGADDPE